MKKISLLFLLYSFCNAASAQHYLGIANSNWGGTNCLYLNPAHIADSRQKLVIDLASVNAGVDNNLGMIQAKNGLIGALSNGETENIFRYTNNGKFSILAPYAEVRGPGLMFSINHKHSFAFTSRIRGINQFHNFDRSFYQTLADPSYVATQDVSLTSKNFNYTAHIWSEIGFTYAAVVYKNDFGWLKAGGTVRYLGGIAYLGLRSNNFDVRYKAGSDTLFVNNSDIEYASNILSTGSAIENGFTNNNIASQFFGPKTGRGIGGDLGVVMECIPNTDFDKGSDDELEDSKPNFAKPQYKLRFSASVTDMGSIKYSSENNATAVVKGNGYLTGEGVVEHVGNAREFKNYISERGFDADTGSATTKVHMPATLVLGADYDIYKQFYINVTYFANLANRQKFGNAWYNQFSVTPRFDSRFLGIALPITYSMLTHSIKTGFSIRIISIFIGSDDIGALYSNNQYGVNLYAGGYIAINKRKGR